MKHEFARSIADGSEMSAGGKKALEAQLFFETAPSYRAELEEDVRRAELAVELEHARKLVDEVGAYREKLQAVGKKLLDVGQELVSARSELHGIQPPNGAAADLVSSKAKWFPRFQYALGRDGKQYGPPAERVTGQHLGEEIQADITNATKLPMEALEAKIAGLGAISKRGTRFFIRSFEEARTAEHPPAFPPGGPLSAFHVEEPSQNGKRVARSL